MLVDTHCHLNLKPFEKDWRKVAERAKKAGVEKMIVVGIDLTTSQKAIAMARKTKGVYATVGLHPFHPPKLSLLNNLKARLKELAKAKEVVAIGECGLDYSRGTKNQNQQKRVLGMQIQLAKELNLPLIINNRGADEALLDVLDHFCKNDNYYPKAVLHCISGSRDYLSKGLELGFYVGVDGNVTYSKPVRDLVKLTPLERLVLETDSPFLTPEPQRRLRNQPINVKIVAEFVAKLNSISLEKIKAVTTKNAKALFGI
jgi:TatD DNase family protein